MRVAAGAPPCERHSASTVLPSSSQRRMGESSGGVTARLYERTRAPTRESAADSKIDLRRREDEMPTGAAGLPQRRSRAERHPTRRQGEPRKPFPFDRRGPLLPEIPACRFVERDGLHRRQIKRIVARVAPQHVPAAAHTQILRQRQAQRRLHVDEVCRRRDVRIGEIRQLGKQRIERPPCPISRAIW